MELLKNIIKVLFSNVASFGTSFIIGFILPAILSISDYGYYKEYMLYLSFASLLNFGYNDGIYIKYGGKTQDELNTQEVIEEHNFVFIFQFIVMVLLLIYSVHIKNTVLILFSISTFFVTMNTYHQNFLQAIGEFNIFSRGSLLKTAFYITILLFGTLVIKSENYVFYIVLNILSISFHFLFFEWERKKKYGLFGYVSTYNKFELFRIGIFVVFANLSLNFVANIGNWIVNIGFSIESFAQYSFQNSLLNVVLLTVNAVGLVFYNVIAKDLEQSILKVIKELSLMLGVFSGIAFFLFTYIIELFLPHYTPAISILSMTFIAIPYLMVSNILIGNVYKTKRSEIKYFKDSVLFAIFSLVLVGTVSSTTRSLTAVALATTLCYISWYIYTSRIEFSYLKGGYKEIILMISHIVWFYVCANILSIGIGFLAYAIYLSIILFMYKNRLKEILYLIQ